jgi:hypothetical protein
MLDINEGGKVNAWRRRQSSHPPEEQNIRAQIPTKVNFLGETLH